MTPAMIAKMNEAVDRDSEAERYLFIYFFSYEKFFLSLFF